MTGSSPLVNPETPPTLRRIPWGVWGGAVLYAAGWLLLGFVGRPMVLRLYGDFLDGARLPWVTRVFLGAGPGVVLAAAFAGGGILLVLAGTSPPSWYRWLAVGLLGGGFLLAAVGVFWPFFQLAGSV